MLLCAWICVSLFVTSLGVTKETATSHWIYTDEAFLSLIQRE